jgi:hypothetical protein
VNQGDTGTCRACGKKISYKINPTAWDTTPMWGDDEGSFACKTKGVHVPQEWCMWRKGDGHACGRRVKPEDILGGFAACGQHMKMELKQHEENRREEERREREQEKQAMLQWEAEVYTQAWDDLHKTFGELIPKALGRDALVRKNWNKTEIYLVDNDISLDMIELRDAVYELLERARDEFATDHG